jgi:predicted permease
VLWSSLGITAGTIAKGGHTRLSALTAPLRYPSIYAALAGLAVNVGEITLPVAIDDAVESLAQASIPCMLVVLGLSFRMPRVEHLEEPLAVSANRLVIGPLAAWPLTALVGLGGITASTQIMMAGMPTAVMTTILALQLGLRSELAVRVVIVSTLCSIVTLTVLITLLR